MTSLIPEEGDAHAEQRSLAQSALTAQLEVLALFLPAAVWRIVQRHNASLSPLISIGPALDTLSDYLDSLVADIAQATDRTNFYCRAVGADDVRRWPDLRTHEIGAVYVLPLVAGSGVTYYLLGLAHADLQRRQSAMLAQACLCINALSASLAMYTKLTTSETAIQAMQRDVFIDPLTNVMNRAGWENSLLVLESMGDENTAIIILDLDMLKQANDTKGHAEGDRLLQQTAQTLSRVLRGSDVVARIGGDEFAIALRDTTPAVANLIVQRLKQDLADVGIQVSMGMALRSEADSMSKAIAIADSRMYSNKRRRAMTGQLSALGRRIEP